MNRTLFTYMLTAIISFSVVTAITMQPISVSAQTQPLQTQQQAQTPATEQPLAISPSCGQVITQNVVLTSNLNCAETDGLIVNAGNIVIDLNGHTIAGPDIDSDTKTSSLSLIHI